MIFWLKPRFFLPWYDMVIDKFPIFKMLIRSNQINRRWFIISCKSEKNILHIGNQDYFLDLFVIKILSGTASFFNLDIFFKDDLVFLIADGRTTKFQPSTNISTNDSIFERCTILWLVESSVKGRRKKNI